MFLQVSISLLLRRLRVWLQTIISVGIVAWTGWLSSRSFVLYDCSLCLHFLYLTHFRSVAPGLLSFVVGTPYFLGPETEVRDLRRLVLQMLPFAGGGRTNRTMVLLVMPDYLSTIPGTERLNLGLPLKYHGSSGRRLPPYRVLPLLSGCMR